MNNKTKTLLGTILLLCIIVWLGKPNIYGFQYPTEEISRPEYTIGDYLYQVGRGAMTSIGRGVYDRYLAYLQNPGISEQELPAKLAEIRAERLREHPLGGTTGGKWLRRIPFGIVAFVCFLIYCNKRREKMSNIKTALKGWGKTITVIASLAIMLAILMIYISKLEKNRVVSKVT